MLRTVHRTELSSVLTTYRFLAARYRACAKKSDRGGFHATTRIAEICRRDGARRSVHKDRESGHRNRQDWRGRCENRPACARRSRHLLSAVAVMGHQVNQAGGLKLKSGQRKVELIEYDDHTQPPEAIKAIERLASIDKADWVVGLYSTGFNVAAVPTFAKLGYPQLAVACVTDLGPQ